jgi:uncharacterized protein (DUF1810 family)
VLQELRGGRKTGHWMWFIFPQVAGLGHSPMSERYAIRSLAEAQAYLAHPLLGARLRECVGLVLEIHGRNAEEVFGPIDARKLRSSMTLFLRAAPGEPLFRRVLDAWFGGMPDDRTDVLLGHGSSMGGQAHEPGRGARMEQGDGDGRRGHRTHPG